MPMTFGEPEDAIVDSSPTPPKPERVTEEPIERAEPEAAPAAEEAESATATEPEVEKVDPKKAPGRLEALAKLTHEANNGEAPVEGDAAEEPEAEVEKTEEEAPEAEKKPEPAAEDAADAELQKGMQEKTAKRFQEILTERKDLKEKLTKAAPVLDFGTKVLAECQKANLHPEQFGRWTKLGLDFHAGNPESIEVLKGMLEQAEAVDRKAHPEKYEMPKLLKEKVEKFEVTPEVANELWEEQKKSQRATRVAPIQQQPPVQQSPIQQSQPQADPLTAGLAPIIESGKAKFKTEWTKVEAMAYEKVKAQGQATPDVLIDRMKRAVTDVENELAAKQRKAAAPPLQSIRPSTRTTGAQPKTGRQSILATLTR